MCTRGDVVPGMELSCGRIGGKMVCCGFCLVIVTGGCAGIGSQC